MTKRFLCVPQLTDFGRSQCQILLNHAEPAYVENEKTAHTSDAITDHVSTIAHVRHLIRTLTGYVAIFLGKTWQVNYCFLLLSSFHMSISKKMQEINENRINFLSRIRDVLPKTSSMISSQH